MPDFASLCFLSFNRPEFIAGAVRSAVENAEYPCEVIVHDDGSDPNVRETLWGLMDDGLVSHLMFNPHGHNEGVGKAINRTFTAARGDPLVKLDQDLLFRPGWLANVSGWLRQDRRVGMFGLFRYDADPVDWRKMNHRPSWTEGDYEYVDDFVGSALVVPRRIYERFGPFEEHSDAFAEDVAYKRRLRNMGYELALPTGDLAVNRGFGPGPSTVVFRDQSGELAVTGIQHGPRLAA
jgi:GT2 family glycosyltransferase